MSGPSFTRTWRLSCAACRAAELRYATGPLLPSLSRLLRGCAPRL